MQLVERCVDGAMLVACCGLQHGAGCASVNDNRHVIARRQLLGQHVHALDDQRQLVRLIHGAGHVQQHHQIERRAFARHQIVALQANMHELAALRPWRGRHRDCGGERLLARLRQRVVVVEIIDQLFDAHGVSRRQAEARYPEILEFAELERFADQRLKNYSSGMLVRLAFAISIHVDADVLRPRAEQVASHSL